MRLSKVMRVYPKLVWSSKPRKKEEKRVQYLRRPLKCYIEKFHSL